MALDPNYIQKYIDIFKNNAVKIDLTEQSTDGTPSTQSKVGGVGYLPVGETYPNINGTPLALLAQINFKEVANSVDMSKLPYPLPQTGIVQIYIDATDDGYGFGYDNPYPSDVYQVRFWADDSLPIDTNALKVVMDTLNTLERCLPFEDENYKKQYTMAFSEYVAAPDLHCVEGENASAQVEGIANLDWNSNELDKLYDAIEAYSTPHGLLGYPTFAQDDPRGYTDSTLDEYILLFKLASEDGLMWGDCGYANFFIHPDDLAKGDFSRLAHWFDCH